MNRIFLYITILLLSFSCKTEKEFEKPMWLIGKWERINKSDATKETHEIWDENLSGVSFSFKDKDTVFTEKMGILEADNKKYLQITGLDRKPTFFEFIQESENSFTCVNLQNQFPEKIHYSLENDNLTTIVSNTDFEIGFIFKKIEE